MIPLFVGLVPGIGDVITTALSLYIVNEARALGASSLLVVRMLLGAVPLFGDVFDVAFRASRRNLALLREHLDGSRRKLSATTRNSQFCSGSSPLSASAPGVGIWRPGLVTGTMRALTH